MVKSNINSILLHFVLVLVVVVFILFPTSSLALSLPSSLSVPSSLPLSISSRTTSISITRRSFSPMLMFTNPTRARFGSSTSTMMLHSISRSISSNISSSISSSISSNNKSNSNISNRSRLCTKRSDTFTMSSFLSSRQSSSSTSLKAIHESKKNGMQEQNSDNGDNNDDNEISFEFESLDKKGQWMTIDYDNIPIGKQKQTNIKDNIDNTNTNNNTNKNNTNNNNNNNNNKLQITFAPENPSPVDTKIINNYNKIVHIKRDDLLHLRKSNVSGNKARKMIALNELHINDFPDVVVSYGGPQSNAMVALAAIVQSKNMNIGFDDDDEENGGDSSSSSSSSSLVDEIESDGWIISDEQYDHNLNNDDDNGNNDNDNGNNDNDNNTSTTKPKRFIYYTKKLPRYLRNQPNGNLLRALSLGMEIVQLHHETYNKLFGGDHGGSSIPPTDIEAPVPGSSLWVPQGGACGLASQGAKFMADEIVSFWEERGKGMPLSVCIPGGTCTTAMLLSREINSILKNKESIRNNADGNNGEEILDIEVVVIPSVGDAGYAFRQMRALDLSTGGNGRDDIPQILKPKRRKNYYRFGEPNAEILKTFLDMQNENDLYLDLLYGAPAWNIIIQNWEAEKYNYDNYDSPIKGRQLMYVHSGGLEGVSSQLTRYKHKGLIDSGQVQS